MEGRDDEGGPRRARRLLNNRGDIGLQDIQRRHVADRVVHEDGVRPRDNIRRAGRGRGRGGHRGNARGGHNIILGEGVRPREQPRDNFGRRGADRGRGRGGHRGNVRGGQNANLPMQMRPIGYHKLQEIERMQEPRDVLFKIANSRSGFPELLKTNMDTNKIELVLSILANALKCEESPSTALQLLVQVKSSNFFQSCLKNYFMDLMSSSDNGKNRQKSVSIKNCLTLMYTLSDRIPSSANDVFTVYAIIESAARVIRVTNPKLLDEDIEHQMIAVRELCENHIVKHRERTVRTSPDEDEEPPDNFRELEIFPTQHELQFNEKPFLRANKTKGSFKTIEQYLDIHFRLMREDFMRPLRDGIALYLHQRRDLSKKKRNTDIRVYTGVQVTYSECQNKMLTHNLCFDVRRLSHVRWQSSKRLIYGSLVCLSEDNFNTMIFATVANRDPIKLTEGNITVRFQNLEHGIGEITERGPFVMAETTAYFEAYRHVLGALQQTETMPFADYIVFCANDIRPPKYINSTSARYDLEPLLPAHKLTKQKRKTSRIGILDRLRRMQARRGLGDIGTLEIEDENVTDSEEDQPALDLRFVKVLDHPSWPNQKDLGLDQSQFIALQSAVTSEFSIIQGPPGTGKTYIGLKLVHALLTNKTHWRNADGTGPILVVCFTNHALDQFVEGIEGQISQKIVRVGGRTKNEKLKNYSLREMRRKLDVGGDRILLNARRDVFDNLEMIENDIHRRNSNIKTSFDEIIREEILESYIDEEHLSSLYEAQMYLPFKGKNSMIVEWLGLGSTSFSNDGTVVNEIETKNGANEEEVLAPEDDADIEDDMTFMQAERILDEDDDGLRKSRVKIEANKDIVAFTADLKPGGQWQISKKEKKARKKRIKYELNSVNVMSKEEARGVHNIWALSMQDRWKLYRLWIHRFRQMIQDTIRTKEQEYEAYSARFREIQDQLDTTVLRQSDVIAMTTTGAAKYRAMLQAVDPRIIIVEEAAEVLESHIITSLTPRCQHLILIGDHKQLRPNPTVYELSRKYNLNLSLFERMVNNGVPCHTLAKQHRMRPEIGDIMRLIYPDLKDHESVLNRPVVKGMQKSVFFVDHRHEESTDSELLSRDNDHEAKFVAGLCNYLLQQGYKTSDITVLTPYTGQLLKLRKLLPKSKFEGMRVCAVDNFQGEENEIIVLSLVRSNDDRKLGFLAEENRVCVALSRARVGLYVIGNFAMLGGNNDMWNKVVSHVKEKNMFGSEMRLQCHNHPEESCVIRSGDDFLQAPEGGCSKPCDFRLDCGHVCRLICHPYDQDHTEYECKKPCPKMCEKKLHRCKRRCYQDCGPCEKTLPQLISKCGHLQHVPCHQEIEKYVCKEVCLEMLECGHQCSNRCGERHSYDCPVQVEKQLPCGHKQKARCSLDASKVICLQPCTSLLECEHKCVGNCSRCHQGRLHVPCTANCGRTLVCGHQCQVQCTKECPPCKRRCTNFCSHSSCKKTCGESCTPCHEKCDWVCRHYKCNQLCNEPCDRPVCNEPCGKALKCGHRCIGLCGEKCPKLCRVCNKGQVEEIFFGTEDEPNARFIQLEDCKHMFEVTSLDQYMVMETDGDADIQFKSCPRCKVPIRKTHRYGKVVKSILNDVEIVKERMAGMKRDVDKEKRKLKLSIPRKFSNDSMVLEFLLNLLKENQVSTHTIHLVESLVKFMETVKNIKEESVNLNIKYKQRYQKHLSKFREWCLSPREYLSDQEKHDATNEIERLAHLANIYTIKSHWVSVNKNAPDAIKLQFQSMYKKIKRGKPLGNDAPLVKKCINEIDMYTTGLGITDRERVEIVKAMGLAKGHWYKCPNGHVYAIADCGGATVESKCPECNAKIGGTNHRLLETNRHAGEMDGSRHAAWSEEANMGNYNMEELMRELRL